MQIKLKRDQLDENQIEKRSDGKGGQAPESTSTE